MLGAAPFAIPFGVFHIEGPIPQLHRDERSVTLPVDEGIAVQGQIRGIADPEAADIPAKSQGTSFWTGELKTRHTHDGVDKGQVVVLFQIVRLGMPISAYRYY